MADLVAKCADPVPPLQGSAFDECTEIVWVQESGWDQPNLTLAEWGQLTGASVLFIVTMAIIRAVRRKST
jgi:hypothetical protein